MNRIESSERIENEQPEDVLRFPRLEANTVEEPDNLGLGEELIWDDDDPPAINYDKLGARLAESGDLFRRPHYGEGLVLLLPGKKTALINKGNDLAPVIVDRVPVRVVKQGKTKGGQIAAAHLNGMLKAESFLKHFLVVDQVTTTPFYTPDFEITKPGYNDGGEGSRVLYLGEEPTVFNSLDRVNAFLDEMHFDTTADRTNAVAALLTVALRNHWPGGKPVIVATATKSHAGKDTVIAFAAGVTKQQSISYQATDWPVEQNFVNALKHAPDIGVMVVENARLGRRDTHIASAFLERFVMDPEPLLASPGTGQPARRRNDIVVAISTNEGSVSEDLMNRALPIHLRPQGNVADRKPAIGNPKYEFLPENRDGIAAEVRGMLEKWKEAGKPMDDQMKHPFSPWAATVGGILAANGFTDFLANYSQRKTADDPLRSSLAILGAALPDQWLRPARWAQEVVNLGLAKRVIPSADRDTDAGRTRGVGVTLSNHEGETFIGEAEAERLTLQLEKKRRRFGHSQPHWRYRFAVTERKALPNVG